MARSSTEAKYRALAQCAAELTWIHLLLVDLHVIPHVPHTLWCDNQSAIALASNPIFHARTKHVEVDYHFIREKVLSKLISVQYVDSKSQITNIFTKSLPVAAFNDLKLKLMVFDTPMSLRGTVRKTH